METNAKTQGFTVESLGALAAFLPNPLRRHCGSCREEWVFWEGLDNFLWIIQKGSGIVLKRHNSH
jgi:hypothetical protein